MGKGDPQLKDRLLCDLSSSIDSRQSEVLVESSAPPSVPDHTLLRRIGKGSYGEVWLARNVMGNFRAAKLVYRRAFDSERPYEREFAGIRRFEPVSRTHPSQLNVLHVGRDDLAGYFYYVMELADDLNAESRREGEESRAHAYAPRTLRSELERRGVLPFQECLAIGTALATALDHLHRNGLVHRDIKPSNIIFVNGIPKLADIGLVAQAEATMSFVGTEGFVPPEGPGNPQADIYSLGKVLYEMSTGRDRQEFPELPTNLIERPAAERAALEELNEVILRACHADPKQRYAGAAELHADLALLESGRSVVRLHGMERRLRFMQRAGMAVTLVAAMAAGLYFWQARQTGMMRKLAGENSRLLGLEAAAHQQALEAQEAAVRDRDRARRSEENTQRVLRFLLKHVVAIARPPDGDAVSIAGAPEGTRSRPAVVQRPEQDGLGMGRDVSVLQALQAAEPSIPRAFAGQPQAELELRTSLADTFRVLGLVTNQAAHRQRALELSEALYGPGSPEVLWARIDLAWTLRDLGQTNEFLSLSETAWQTASNALGAADERTLDALGWLGAVYRDVGRKADSVRVLEGAVQTARAAFGDDDPRTSILMGHLGWSYYHTGQYEQAIPLLEHVLTIRKRTLGPEHYHTTGVMNDLGRAYLAVGREREAFSLLEEGYETCRRVHGPQHENTLLAVDVLAGSSERAGRTNDALSWHTLALHLREAKLGPDQASTVRSRNDVLRLRAVLAGTTNQPAR